MLPKNWKPQEVFGLSTQTWGVLALQAAVKVDVFTPMDTDQGASAAELAKALQVNERALGMLLTALTSMQFIEREGDRFFLTESSRRYLSKKSDEYYGSIILHSDNILHQWVHLDESVRTGLPIPETEMTPDEIEKERQDFLMGMFNVAQHQAHMVADAFDLKGRTHLLDMGGGSGTYAIHFCQKNPTLHATIVDLLTTKPYAESVINQYQMADRVDFVAANFLTGEFPQNVDATWLSQVLHGESPEGAQKLVQRASDAMASGGVMGIQEFMLANDLKGPMHSALFSLNMLLQTDGGQSYTVHEIRTMMGNAGIKNIRFLEVALPPSCKILIGEKAA